jgi:hypothetical protein
MPRSHHPLFWLAMARAGIGFAVAPGPGVLVWYRKRSARYWPMTHGKVEHGRTSDGDGWKSNLSWSYNVGGEF